MKDNNKSENWNRNQEVLSLETIIQLDQWLNALLNI